VNLGDPCAQARYLPRVVMESYNQTTRPSAGWSASFCLEQLNTILLLKYISLTFYFPIRAYPLGLVTPPPGEDSLPLQTIL